MRKLGLAVYPRDAAAWRALALPLPFVLASASPLLAANEMRRDTNQLRQNDTFAVLFDTFHDRRNGYLFYANPIGGLADSQITDERPPYVHWNTVWSAKTGRFDRLVVEPNFLPEVGFLRRTDMSQLCLGPNQPTGHSSRASGGCRSLAR